MERCRLGVAVFDKSLTWPGVVTATAGKPTRYAKIEWFPFWGGYSIIERFADPTEMIVSGRFTVDRRVRIGAVQYLNARPLTVALAELAPRAEITVDLPSRLADGLAAGRLDVALIPSIEFLRHPDCTIVSDVCIACEGPVKSVMLYGRVPVEKIGSLALDEGSRTSATLARVMLKERFGLTPRLEPLPIGATLSDTAADAVVLIGDRGMVPPKEPFAFVWDLGEQWLRWIGLPFVFAMWIARPNLELDGLDALFAAAREEGLQRLESIAKEAYGQIGISYEECLVYLRDHLTFHLGQRQWRALETFCRLAVQHQLAPSGADRVFHDHKIA
jgi:chorismate dehydratase